jgi:cation transport ATPase
MKRSISGVCCGVGSSGEAVQGTPATPVFGRLTPVVEQVLAWRERLGLQCWSSGLWVAACTLTLLEHAFSWQLQSTVLYVCWVLAKRASILASLLISGLPALLDMIVSFWERPSLSVDVLMTLAALLLLAVGHVLEGALLLVLFSLSRAAEGAIQARARRDLDALRDGIPEYAWRLPAAQNADVEAARNHQTSHGAEPDAYRVPVTELQPNDLILIKVGEVVPCDSLVSRGDVYVSFEPITGESVPRRVREGDSIQAGARAVDGSVILQVLRPVHESAVARIARLVTEAQQNKPTLERWIDRFGQLYSRLVLLGATLVFLLSSLTLFRTQHRLPKPAATDVPNHEQPVRWRIHRQAVDRALGFLVVASPCALIIGAPVAYTSALSVLARRGVLVKGGARTLEASARCSHVAFDKTGTLTKGEPQLFAIHLFRDCKQIEPKIGNVPSRDNKEQQVSSQRVWVFSSDADRELQDPSFRRVLALAAGLETHVVHPLASAVAAAASKASIDPLPFQDIKMRTGAGLEGRLMEIQTGYLSHAQRCETADHGTATTTTASRVQRVRLGRSDYALALGEDSGSSEQAWMLSSELQEMVKARQLEQSEAGRSTALLCSEDGTIAMLVFWDEMRSEAPTCISELRSSGYDVQLLTGDSRETAFAIAEAVGMPLDSVRYGLQPEEKMLFVKERSERLVMVGDGMNDAPALALANTGVSIGFHSATAVSAADVVLVDGHPDGIRRLAWYLRKSRQTQQVIYQNVAIALVLIVSTAMGAVSGGLPLWAAVVLHEGGTLLVGLSGLRLLMD